MEVIAQEARGVITNATEAPFSQTFILGINSFPNL